MQGRPAALVTSRPNVPFPGKVFRTVQEDVPQMKDVIDRMIAELS